MNRTRPVQLLLVEDNADDVIITRRALSKSVVANDLHVARDGQEAMDFLFHTGGYDASTPRPDVVLLDINLPRVNGIEVLSRIRENPATALIPVIMLTASSRDQDVARSYGLGSNTYIQKPVEFDRFLRTLDVLAQYWVVVATAPPAMAA